jgi:hypothetical protein
MMDRLTKLDEKTKNYLIACRIACGACEENLLSASCSMQDAVLQKCGQYEDSGLTPERAQELGKADAEGRVVVLPCKLGETIYVLIDKTNVSKYGKQKRTFAMRKTELSTDNALFMAKRFGTKVFTDREEAYSALAKMKEADDGQA